NLTSFMYQGSFNHSACKNSSFSIGFLLYFNILYTKIKFYLIDLRKSQEYWFVSLSYSNCIPFNKVFKSQSLYFSNVIFYLYLLNILYIDINYICDFCK
ncbi:MAG: hypothetical protein Q9M94_04725, partial [Candidatus Gracilibacteria bacterium]|nr:hypothetical protein [Candidatus Gracilibacteria bacterium]